jgi:iron complex transport system substrate-binding protein
MSRLGLLLALALTACAPAAPPAQGGRLVRQVDGREVRIPARARRIFPANSCAMELAGALVDDARIVGLPATAYPFSLLAREPQRWSAHQRAASWIAEDVLALDPDLVLVHDWQEFGTAERLRDHGIAVFALPTVHDWDDLTRAIRLASDVLDAREPGAALLADLERRRARLATRAGLSGVRVLSFGNYGTGGSSAGAGTTWDLMTRLSGLANAAAEAGLEGNQEVDLEQVLTFDPDVLVFSRSWNGDTCPSLDWMRGQSVLDALPALHEGRYVVLDPALFSTSSHHLLEAAEELARAVAELEL